MFLVVSTQQNSGSQEVLELWYTRLLSPDPGSCAGLKAADRSSPAVSSGLRPLMEAVPTFAPQPGQVQCLASTSPLLTSRHCVSLMGLSSPCPLKLPQGLACLQVQSPGRSPCSFTPQETTHPLTLSARTRAMVTNTL